ncbi:hypothetical protein BDR26DRAFT_867028 [Obelidium mucronatum]|nr:hypothetical protein BDR26DRAFT_867028 [Obelidium mucronatum]
MQCPSCQVFNTFEESTLRRHSKRCYGSGGGGVGDGSGISSSSSNSGGGGVVSISGNNVDDDVSDDDGDESNEDGDNDDLKCDDSDSDDNMREKGNSSSAVVCNQSDSAGVVRLKRNRRVGREEGNGGQRRYKLPSQISAVIQKPLSSASVACSTNANNNIPVDPGACDGENTSAIGIEQSAVEVTNDELDQSDSKVKRRKLGTPLHFKDLFDELIDIRECQEQQEGEHEEEVADAHDEEEETGQKSQQSYPMQEQENPSEKQHLFGICS